MKKLFLLFLVLALSFVVYGCGGGAGSPEIPHGENPGIASVVELLPVHFIAQTNSSIFLRTKVLDGNGIAVPNTQVVFTNLSLTGTLSSTIARTDGFGIASVRLDSSTAGFVTVQAEINTGAGIVRDKKTVFFSSFDIALPVPPAPPGPTLTLEVDGDNDGIFDEAGDFTLLENTTDNQVIVRATVLQSGDPVSGSAVTFGADSPEAAFPDGRTKTTDANGQAFTRVVVTPADLRNLSTILNITASADNGAFNLVSLFLAPVTVNTVSVFANPLAVESGGTAQISANVTTTAGTPVPNGTTVNFTTTAGGVEPFSQTTGGIAEATFTAPTVTFDTTATITASVGGESGSVNVTVTAPIVPPVALAIAPAAATVTPPNSVQFTISGGVAPFTVTSSNQAVIPNPGFVGTTFTVTPGSVAAVTTVTLTVVDSAGASVSSTVTVNPDFFVVPPSATLTVGAAAGFTIVGGVSPFQITTNNPGVASIAFAGGNSTTFTLTGTAAGTANITVRDSVGKQVIVTVTVTALAGP